MECAKCKKKATAGINGLFKRYGHVPELKRFGILMKRYRLLCKDCMEEVND